MEKEYYGNVSFAGKAQFSATGKDKEEVENLVFDDIEGIELILKDGSKLKLGDIEWDLIREQRYNGNVGNQYIDDFEIYEEK